MAPPFDPKRDELSKILKDLPRVDVTRTPATTRDQSAREDVAYGVNSLDDAVREATRRLDKLKKLKKTSSR
jgi:hypothetical protein